MKKLTALLLVLAMLVTLAACTKKDEKKEPKDSTAPIETKAPAQLVDAPVLNINEIYGLSPEGQKATLANTLSLTDEDKAAVKEGNYKVAICMHQMDNDVNVMKVNTIKKILGDLGVEIIAVTDGQSSVEQMTTNLETVIAMKPNAIISIAYDVNAMVGIFEKCATPASSWYSSNAPRPALSPDRTIMHWSPPTTTAPAASPRNTWLTS